MKKSKPPAPQSVSPISRPFPPRRNFSSLSVRDLLEAREAHRVYLAGLENVVATAVGLYRIHQEDWYATHPPDEPRPPDFPHGTKPRTLGNSIVRSWSWPAVLVFVRKWNEFTRDHDQIVPRFLYLPDGRAIPTCVIEATPDESPPPPVPGPSQVSPLLGGGYSYLREHQGTRHLGTFACLVHREGSYYALTNRHVTGCEREDICAYVHGEYRRVGQGADLGVHRFLMSEIFPSWPGANMYLHIDAGLVRIDNLDDWTAQVFGIGEVGPVFDATEQSVLLDLIGCPVRAFGGTGGVLEGEIQALFFRYESQSGYDWATDVLIGPRTGSVKPVTSAPFTQPGDSGTLWFYDPPREGPKQPNPDMDDHLPPERGQRARRLRPVALQWGGTRFQGRDGSSGAYALASFMSTVCHVLDVEIVRDWSTGHDEYWGKLGHFTIGWKACNRLKGRLSTLMMKNQARIGFGDDKLKEGSEFRVGRDGFVPLADVPDYVWVNCRPCESVQHFADVDIGGIDGGPTLLERCCDDPANISAGVWKSFFDGFKQAGVGPEEGVLPLRVWQIWDAMVGYLKDKNVLRFVAAAGVLAHYVADASQPLHCSYLHHGVPPMVDRDGREFPAPRDSDAFKKFKKSREYKIHSIYDETVLEVDTPAALAHIDQCLADEDDPPPAIRTGHQAAIATVHLMNQSRQRLSPQAIIDADDPELGPKARAQRLWEKPTIQDALIESLADSVRLLADLWTSAWKAGHGNAIDASKLVTFAEKDLEKVYRDNQKFVPSWSLAKMKQSGHFEP